MQQLARDGLTAEQVTALLQSDDLQVSAGCELLRADLTVVEDISDDLAGGRIDWNGYRAPHRQCSLALARELVWGVDLVRPYMTLTDREVTARFNTGVYVLTTPDSTFGEDPITYDVTGADRTLLLDREVAQDWTATAGTTYRAALLAAFTGAGLTGVLIDGVAADSTLPADASWPLVGSSTDPDQTSTPATWRRVINDLLMAINFRAVYADENGLLRCEAYLDPTFRGPEFVFDADDLVGGIVGEDRSRSDDLWSTPNKWVFRQTNRPPGAPAATEGDGIYTVLNQSEGPTSIDRRGLVWPRVVDYEAASQSKLVELGDRRVALDRRRTARVQLTTEPFPCAGHFDVFTYTDAVAGGSSKVQAAQWSLDLAGAAMPWTWEVVA